MLSILLHLHDEKLRWPHIICDILQYSVLDEICQVSGLIRLDHDIYNDMSLTFTKRMTLK